VYINPYLVQMRRHCDSVLKKNYTANRNLMVNNEEGKEAISVRRETVSPGMRCAFVCINLLQAGGVIFPRYHFPRFILDHIG